MSKVSGAGDLASKSLAGVHSTNVKLKEETEDSCQMKKIRCLCESTLPTDSMIKCDDPSCNIWQHKACVLIPEDPMDVVLPKTPDIFYCVICRLNRADPFWATVAHPLHPFKWNIPDDRIFLKTPRLRIENTFQLTRINMDLLSKPEYDIQAWCMLLNDKVTFRMHWPQFAQLHVNGEPVKIMDRPSYESLGANGRDHAAVITPCTREGINTILLQVADARIFCLGIRIVLRRSLAQVLSIIPKEAEGERFEDALARVHRCVGGGAATENAYGDRDMEVIAGSVPVSLRCPISGLRMKVAGRFKPCAHMGCFDLEVFVEMNQHTQKWQCPICLKNYYFQKIIIDPYFNRITSKMRNCGEDVTEIEVKPDGSWRAKAEGDQRALGELSLWHSPDGAICASAGAESDNGNSPIEFSKLDNMHGASPANTFQENFDNDVKNIIPTSDEVIVISDSEEDVEPLMSSGNVYENDGGVQFPNARQGIPDSCNENPILGDGGSSSLDLYNEDDDYEVNIDALISSIQANIQGGPDFPLAGSDGLIGSYSLNSGQVDNHLALTGNDQIFRPTGPSDASVPPPPLRGNSGISNDIHTEDQLSLRLGNGLGSGGGTAGGGGDGGGSRVRCRESDARDSSPISGCAKLARFLR